MMAKEGTVCEDPMCDDIATKEYDDGSNLCAKHYSQWSYADFLSTDDIKETAT